MRCLFRETVPVTICTRLLATGEAYCLTFGIMTSTRLFDYVLTNATLIDGSGSAGFVADLAIQGGRIAAIGDLASYPAARHIDVTDKVVAPGFIDVHTHDDNAVFVDANCFPKVSQGVTTVIVGNCGISAAPAASKGPPPEPLNLLGAAGDFPYQTFAEYVAAVNDLGTIVNVAALVGHTSLRIKHVGDLNRAATATEIAAMQARVEEAMAAGARGVSTGLAYQNALASTTDEVASLARVAGRFGGIYTTHLRNEFDAIGDALDEAFTIGEVAELPVVVSHLKCAGPQNWGRASEVLNRIADSGLRTPVHMDCYPYAAGSSNLDLGQVDERVKILITRSEPHPEQSRKTLAAIATEWGTSQHEAARRLMPAGAIYFSIDENDMRSILSHDRTMIGSDGLPHDEHPHPRLFGTFPRVLGRYCRDEGLLPLETAIAKMTSLPAKVFSLDDRGEIQPGFFADLVVFDPRSVVDKSDYEAPTRVASGIDYVFVSGSIVYEHGNLTGVRTGGFLKPSD